MQKLKKEEKLEKEKRIYNHEKSKENDMILKNKLKAINDERNEKLQALNQKFSKMTDFKKQMADSKQEYMSAKKEENMFKFMDLGENR